MGIRVVRNFIFNLPDHAGTVCDWRHLRLVFDLSRCDGAAAVGLDSNIHGNQVRKKE